jgi:hypothetical protein
MKTFSIKILLVSKNKKIKKVKSKKDLNNKQRKV